MRRLLWGLFLISVIAAAAWWISSMREDKGIVVETRSVEVRDEFRSHVTASGEIVASRYVDVGSNVMGRIVELPVKEGQLVQVGQLLARIDPAQAASEFAANERQVQALKAEVEVARRQLTSSKAALGRVTAVAREAQLTFQRTRDLVDKGVESQAQLDQAAAAQDSALADVAVGKAEIERTERFLTVALERVEQARARLQGAQDILTKTEIRAPMSGVVSRLLVRQGEMVVVGIQNAPGTTLMTISDLSGINAEVKVAEADILRIQLGQTAGITLDAVPRRVFSGKVTEIGTSALALAGTGVAAREFKVVVGLDEPGPGLLPGLTCDAEILTDQLKGVTVVPLQAVVLRMRDEGETTGVFLAREGKAVFQPVKVGVIGGLEVSIEGISAGALVVTGPFQVLRSLEEGAKLAL